MKNIFLTLTLAAISVAAAAQRQLYDSLSNFLGERVDLYVGQVLFARGNNGYSGFAAAPDFDLGPHGRNVFCSTASKTPLQNVSAYDLMAGHYFSVDGVVTRTVKAFTRGGLTHYLELTDMNTGDKCYYAYEAQNPESSKDIVVVGYYEKMRSMLIGNIFIFTGREPVAYRQNGYVGLHDMATKELRKEIPVGSEWKCTDIAIENGNDHQVIGILENPQYGSVYATNREGQNRHRHIL